MARRITVLELLDLLKRLRQGQSIKSIRRELGRHKTVIRKVKRISEKHGWLECETPLPSEGDLQEVYEKADGEVSAEPHALDRFKVDIKRWVCEEDYSL